MDYPYPLLYAGQTLLSDQCSHLMQRWLQVPLQHHVLSNHFSLRGRMKAAAIPYLINCKSLRSEIIPVNHIHCMGRGKVSKRGEHLLVDEGGLWERAVGIGLSSLPHGI